ncbi:hybrid sensor histidine kinase/response regulator [Paraburkholderia hospita]|uniref:hybrid sensor histidine kinase/response regulator n=1 Tax=Paraburkholderia hospita TaxID=169430 RepID=UPI000B34274B|nr:ATP-binding protein [Paraburkholderia hospita]OUL93728.1 hybrid sensor histidine kinase/response regulator [Paraburkholderia hospita]
MSRPSALPVVTRVQQAGALITAELDARLRRSPDYAAENETLHALAGALTASHTAMLQTLVDTALALCDAGSAGISLREGGAGHASVYRWVAVSGRCADLVGHIIPSDDSPAGVAIAFGAPQLFAYPKRQFDCLVRIVPEVTEELVVPVPGTPAPWGALWVMSHDGDHHFDSEHRRILKSLADFTCAALSIAKAKADAETRAMEAEAARNALSEAECAKDNFIATLGHELRGPLAPIESALAAAQKLAAGSPAVLSALAVANRQVQQLKRIVSDLLDASRVRHGKLSVRPAYALLGDIVKDALAAVSDEVERRRHQLHATLPPYPVTVFADAARLTQVISNLLGNAVKYTPHGGVITVQVDAPESGTIPEHDLTPRELVITIRDNGVGIAPDLLPRVFDLFAQSPSARAGAEGGLGLGLSVVKYLVNAHQGQVSISSGGEGKGTEVVLQLPVVHRSDVEHAAPTTHGIQPARILLVDDNADATEALAMLLSLDGHEVKRAQNGPEALSIVESFTPDFALIDIHMPGMDGHELARLLREREQCASTLLVALTGYGRTAGADGGSHGFDCYLLKPPSLEDLADVLRR